MVFDYVKNIECYNGILPNFAEGVAFALSLQDKPVGRYEQGEIFAMVQEGETTSIDEGLFESHRKYVDVQFVIGGKELVEWQEIAALTEEIPYDETKDAGFWKGSGDVLEIKEGMFYVAFPQDGHKPCKHAVSANAYRKIVLKLKAK